jgi:hypothetical protein
VGLDGDKNGEIVVTEWVLEGCGDVLFEEVQVGPTTVTVDIQIDMRQFGKGIAEAAKAMEALGAALGKSMSSSFRSMEKQMALVGEHGPELLMRPGAVERG